MLSKHANRKDEPHMVHFGNDWDTILDGEFAKTYYQNLRQFLLTEYRTQTI